MKRPGVSNPFDKGYSYQKANGGNIVNNSLEDDYDNHVDALSTNIGAIKDIAIQMKNHLQGEKGMHDSIDGQFDKASNLMNFTTKKIDEILSSSTGRVSCYLILAVIFFLVILYTLG